MEGCFVFVDDSNLWIAGQKAHAQKLQDANKDPRCRIDLGRLLQLVVGKRIVIQAYLYGSRPPPNDTVWTAATQKNFMVEIFERAGGVVQGREKEVDHAMTGKIVYWATRLTYDQVLREHIDDTSVAFVVVTGDRDMNSAVSAALDQHIRVELWSWKDSLATVYKQQANATQLLSLHEFDTFSGSFTYTSVQSTHSRVDIDPSKAIVFVGLSNSFAKRSLPSKLLQLYRLFYVTLVPVSEETCDAIVEFTSTRVDLVLKELRERHGDFDLNVCTYPEYKSKHHQQFSEIPTFNRFAALAEVEESCIDEALGSLNVHSQPKLSTEATLEEFLDETSSEDSDSWSVVLRRNPGAKTYRDKLRSSPCKWGIHCARASSCIQKHSEKEKKLFEDYKGRITFQYWKTKSCNKHEPHNVDSCPFAHESEDAWCLKCKSWGHFTNDCRSPV